MKTCAIVIAIALLSFSVARGDLEIRGYFEPQFTGMVVDDEFHQLNSNKLRIDLSSELSDNLTFTGNINYIDYNGKTDWNLLDFIPDTLFGLIKVGSVDAYAYQYEDDYKLDNAYLRLYSESVTLTVGRQQLSVGSGYAWNPTDVFNAKDILDPTYEQPGLNTLRGDIALADNCSVVLYYLSEDTWRESGKLVRLLGNALHFDLALSAVQWHQEWTDYYTFESSSEKQTMFGFDINGELLGVGFWSENARGLADSSDNYWVNLVGIDYTYESGWYVMGEYYHDERSRENSEKYTFNDWVRYLTGNSRTLAADQMYVYTSYPLTDLMDISGSVVYSISDESALLIPRVEYSVSDDVTFSVFGSIYTGKVGTMYTSDMGSEGVVRLRAYF